MRLIVIVQVLVEVPTGVVTDVHSHHLILIGIALMGCSYALEGALSEFCAALVSRLCRIVGYT